MRSIPGSLAVALLCASSFWAGTALAAGGKADVYRSSPGKPLAPASGAAPAAVVAKFARAHGRDPATLRPTGQSRSANGNQHLRYEQVIGGYRVAGAYLKATVSPRGELLHVIDALAPSPKAKVAAPRVSAAAAQDAAFASLGYSASTAFYKAPVTERVVLRDASGALGGGYEVRTWTLQGNELHHTLVDGQGRVVAIESRTANDSYNVFVEDPSKGVQAVVTGGPTAESPVGWLFAGEQNTIKISGNNTSTYLDARPNNRPDRGGTIVTDGNFLSVADLAVSPSAGANPAVAVQNLFFQNNVIHDILYGAGFTEATGNFQADNFGNGGADGDPVKAEAQDGGGTDNANFATPADGSSPRMQMYLWSSAIPDHEVVVNAPSPATYAARLGAFSPALDTTGLTGDVVLVNDGVDPASDGCTASGSSLAGKIALIDRGACPFVDKVLNAQGAGAVGVIVANNNASSPDEVFVMGGDTHRVRIPAVLVSLNSGNALKAALAGLNVTARHIAVEPPMIDGDLDADIVYHEYGHGLTWRMIGGMSGPMAGAVGEGASDVVAFLVNGDDRIGEYSYSDANGIRRYPYDGYPLTYGDVDGGEVHNDGEVYAAAMWRLRELWLAAGFTDEALLGVFVDGMNYTPATPAFEDMRDGMLASVAGNAQKECLVWEAFAHRGIGVGASGTTTAPITIVESFERPASCP
jgi:extracellular elastinolytic metalloproteinase